MSDGRPAYTDYHPRWLRYRTSTYWWMWRRRYFMFILRELSSIFVAWFVVYLLLLVRAIGQGAVEYRQFLDWSAQPIVLVPNLVSLFFVVFHAVTWFSLAPKAMVVQVAGTPVPGWAIAGANYGMWAATTAAVGWLLLGA